MEGPGDGTFEYVGDCPPTCEDAFGSAGPSAEPSYGYEPALEPYQGPEAEPYDLTSEYICGWFGSGVYDATCICTSSVTGDNCTTSGPQCGNHPLYGGFLSGSQQGSCSWGALPRVRLRPRALAQTVFVFVSDLSERSTDHGHADLALVEAMLSAPRRRELGC